MCSIYIFYNIITKIFKIKTGDGIFTKIFITFYYIITKIFKKQTSVNFSSYIITIFLNILDGH
jgi:hypothetical protein